MSDPTASLRSHLRGTTIEVPAHQWWDAAQPPGSPLRIRVSEIDEAGLDDPVDGWVWAAGHRCGPAGPAGPGDARIRVLIQLSALPAPPPPPAR